MIVVVEPPFVSPSLPRPQVAGVAAAFQTVPGGEDTEVFDLNLHLYRSVVGRAFTLTELGERTALAASFRRAFFESGAVSQGASPVLRASLAAIGAGNAPALNGLIAESLARLDGRAPHETKTRYVEDQQVLNAVLAQRADEREPGASLSLEEFAPPPGDQLDLASYVEGDTSFLWRWLEADGTALWPSTITAAVVLVNDWSQLAAGLITARWLKERCGVPVGLAGDLQPWKHYTAWQELVRRCCSCSSAGHPLTLAARLGMSRVGDGLDTAFVPGLSAPSTKLRHFSPHPLVSARATSRCYWAKCAFCVQAGDGERRFGRWGAAQLRAAMHQLAEHAEGPALQFLDCALPPVFLEALAGLEQQGVRWSAQVRLERKLVKDPELFSRLARAGCVQLAFGFETGSPALLARMRKGATTNPAARLEILRRSATAGIRNHLFVITGFPGEDEADFASTLSFLEKAIDVVDSVEAHAFQMQPGAPVFNDPERFGLEPHASPSLGLDPAGCIDAADRLEAERRSVLVRDLLMPWMVRRGSLDYLEGHASFRGLPGWP